MNTLFTKKIVSLAIIFGCTSSSFGWINLSEFDKAFDEMEKSFKRMRKDMRDDVQAEFKNIDASCWKVTYHEKSGGKSLKVVISGVDTHNIDSQLNDDDSRLSIIVDSGTIVIKVLKNWISLLLEKGFDHRESTKNESKKHTSLSTVSSSQTVAHAIELVGAEIDYKASEKTLTIMIPYKKTEQNKKKIPVTMQ